ncbi:hypothetical protein [Pseudomonas sp. GZD-222]|uniref:hypothetical protein n=1 Tax=Pseudomonas sp. GZD-222 TaxID=3404805 RepID=UPI003BB5525D
MYLRSIRWLVPATQKTVAERWVMPFMLDEAAQRLTVMSMTEGVLVFDFFTAIQRTAGIVNSVVQPSSRQW